MIPRDVAKDLVEMIESCQWERAKALVLELQMPEAAEQRLLFCVSLKGQATARIFEAKHRQIEQDVQEAVLKQDSTHGQPNPGTYEVFRVVLHGEYETAKVARRK